MSVPASHAPTAHGQLPLNGYVRISQLIPGVFPMSRGTFLRRVKDGAADGSFPQPVKLGTGRAVYFNAQDIRSFIASHSAAQV
jgi:predicted DNA-binding transcriptional regulator AlpA